jgi:hypothetical protein
MSERPGGLYGSLPDLVSMDGWGMLGFGVIGVIPRAMFKSAIAVRD